MDQAGVRHGLHGALAGVSTRQWGAAVLSVRVIAGRTVRLSTLEMAGRHPDPHPAPRLPRAGGPGAAGSPALKGLEGCL